MHGEHRSTAQSPFASALKSAAWLLMVVAVVMLPLAWLGLLAFGIYLAVADQTDSWRFIIALESALWIWVFGHLAWVWFRHRPRSAAKLVGVINEGLLLLSVTIVLLGYIGQQQGWMHGPFLYAMIGVGAVLFLGIGAYWTLGERRLTAFLKARAADRQTP
jgi:hypothetical protein